MSTLESDHTWTWAHLTMSTLESDHTWTWAHLTMSILDSDHTWAWAHLNVSTPERGRLMWSDIVSVHSHSTSTLHGHSFIGTSLISIIMVHIVIVCVTGCIVCSSQTHILSRRHVIMRHVRVLKTKRTQDTQKDRHARTHAHTHARTHTLSSEIHISLLLQMYTCTTFSPGFNQIFQWVSK